MALSAPVWPAPPCTVGLVAFASFWLAAVVARDSLPVAVSAVVVVTDDAASSTVSSRVFGDIAVWPALVVWGLSLAAPCAPAANGVVLERDDVVVATDVRSVNVFSDEVATEAVEDAAVTPGGSVVTPVDPGGTVIG